MYVRMCVCMCVHMWMYAAYAACCVHWLTDSLTVWQSVSQSDTQSPTPSLTQTMTHSNLLIYFKIIQENAEIIQNVRLVDVNDPEYADFIGFRFQRAFPVESLGGSDTLSSHACTASHGEMFSSVCVNSNFFLTIYKICLQTHMYMHSPPILVNLHTREV